MTGLDVGVRGSGRRARGQWRTAIAMAIVMLMGLLVPGAEAQVTACGPIVPTSEVARGMVGTGLTVVQGTDPEPFDVEVLGVLQGGIGPGRDMIIVEVTAPFIEEVGGIWQGMSGSPVYVGDRLLGAVAYGLAFSPSGIGGLTPAEDMVELFDLPSSFSSAGTHQGSTSQDGADEVVVDGELAAEIRSRLGDGGTFAQSSGVSLRRLPVPLSVSGLSADRLDVLQDTLTARGYGATAQAGAATSFSQVPTVTTPPGPGDNLAVALSVGDLTAAGVGTATVVCDGQLLGFGHPFAFRGASSSGAMTADAITIVPDSTFAPYKLANVDALFGTIDQDRLAGVRAATGDLPDRTPITSRVTDSDLDRSRTGRTDVFERDAIADLAPFHTLGNIDTVIDRIGEGTAQLTYTATGTGSESGAFTLRRENVHASRFDVAFESIFEMLVQLSTVQQFQGEDVTIDRVRIDATVEEAVATYSLGEVRVGIDGLPPEPVAFGEVAVQPGSVVDIEVDLDGGDGTTRTSALQVVVPDDAFGFGFVEVVGGSQLGFDCLFDPSFCPSGDSVETAQDLADQLAAQPRNDEVSANLLVPTLADGGQGPFPGPTPEPVPGQPGPDEPSPAPQPTPDPEPAPASRSAATYSSGEPRYAQVGTPVSDRDRVDRVVQGAVGFGVFVDSPICPGCPPTFNRVAGDDRIGTAAGIATTVFGISETVVLAPADDYPSALVAGPLASLEFAPVLLTGQDGLAPATEAAIRSLSASRVVVVAPDGQLDPAVEALEAMGIPVIERIGGADRYEVAARVAERVIATTGNPRAWLVEGENADPARGWPDAVSAGVLAGYEGVPILLTRAGDLPAPISEAVSGLGIQGVSIAGGEVAVSAAVAADLEGRGVAVDRVAGSSRDETSYLLAQRAIELGAFAGNTWMVTAGDFPDALAAAPAVVATGGVMIMGDGTDLFRTPGAVRHFDDLRSTAPFVTFVGGFAAISQDVEIQIFDLLIAPPGGTEVLAWGAAGPRPARSFPGRARLQCIRWSPHLRYEPDVVAWPPGGRMWGAGAERIRRRPSPRAGPAGTRGRRCRPAARRRRARGAASAPTRCPRRW